jgi:hypothetical protein
MSAIPASLYPKIDEAMGNDKNFGSLPAESAEDTGTGLRFLFLSFLTDLFKLGLTKTLELEDCGIVSQQDDCIQLYKRFSVFWESEHRKPHHKRSLWMVLLRTIGIEII